MKFVVRAITQPGARVGNLYSFARLPEVTLETPLLLLHTRGGSVPHLSHDLLQMVTKDCQALQVPVVTVVDSGDSIRAFGKSVAEFSGLKECLAYITVQDSGTATPQGYHEKHSLSIWTRGGRRLLDASTYMSSIEAMKPDWFQYLVDADTNVNSSSKRLQKSVDRTVDFAKICFSIQQKSEVLKEIPAFISIVGGYSEKERTRCAKLLAEYDAAGYTLDGFHNNGEDAMNLQWEDMKPVLTETIAGLPENKPRVFHGAVTPWNVLKLASIGIDIFDATFPWIIAEKGGALVFPNFINPPCNPAIHETLPDVKGDVLLDGDQPQTEKNGKTERMYDINLNDKRYFADSKPLLAECTCYTCRKYSRSYIHHLIVNGELVGPLLLMMHNLHHYIAFFQNIRQAIKDSQLDKMELNIKTFLQCR
nr:EOG090X08JG [Cyclestheria hislopi]